MTSIKQLLRMDVYYTISTSLSLFDTLRASVVQVRHLLLALSAGEPERIVLALNLEAMFLCLFGSPSADGVLAKALDLAQRVGGMRVESVTRGAAAVFAFARGRWQEADRLFRSLTADMDARAFGTAWERNSARLFHLNTQWWLGELRRHAELTPSLRRDAAQRGDLFAEIVFSEAEVLDLLCADRPEEARALLARCEERSQGRFPNMDHGWYQVMTDLYCGASEAAWRDAQAFWALLGRSGGRRVQNWRIMGLYLRAQTALRMGRRRQARRAAEALAREDAAWGPALGSLVRAAMLERGPRDEAAVRAWAEAETALAACNMALFCTLARRPRGQLCGGPAGEAMVRDVDEWMHEQGIVCPAKLAGALV